ncbi:MAG TPA: glycosyltransferase family 1 protein [bacterium]|nr:glycosyltransferase family 1 protein [bacterium]
MKILMINKFYFLKGGSERYFFELGHILRSHGHEVIPFSMKHPENEPTPYTRYFVEEIEFNLDSAWQRLINGIRIAGRILYSWQARHRLETLIRATRPQVAHCHMIDHQISPSILHTLRKHRIPVLLTTHQTKIICPNYRLFNWSKMRVCEKCLSHHYYWPVIEKCHKNSRMAGLLIAVESYSHHVMRLYEKYVDVLHVPSCFFRQKFIQAGYSAGKISQLYYTIQVDRYEPRYTDDDYFLYFGRIEEAKGLDTLLSAMHSVPQGRLFIVGRGDYEPELKNRARKTGLKNVTFLGPRFGEELKEIVQNCQFVIVPSECYDNSPLVIYEAYALGKPVIGADIGGIPELIEEGCTGKLFQAGNAHELAIHIRWMLNNPQLRISMGRSARQKAEREFSPEVHYQKIFDLYQNLLKRGKT